MGKEADSYDPYERKREIKQLEKSYMVLCDWRENNPNPTPNMWFYLEMYYYYKLRSPASNRPWPVLFAHSFVFFHESILREM